ncbi:MAG: Gfo/Idh/MocA family oxidoreductase [Chloroflexi bacterium]|mgnify:CR=1 FL=1|nr:Gfo/Idh/MocA family oxidoreductase [Chloroflexota bacterium]
MAVLRIGIIGTENSHAVQACKRFNVDQTIPEGKVVVMCPGQGDTMKHCKQIAKDGLVPEVVRRPADLVDKCDLVIIMNRNGKYHTPSARLSLRAGVPTFVDKPLTCSVREASELIDLAHKNNTWLSSWSTLWHTESFRSFLAEAKEKAGATQIGMAGGPCDLDSEHGGVFFYGIHTVELALQGYGYDVESLSAVRSAESALVNIKMQSGVLVTLHMIKAYIFQMLVHGEQGSAYRALNADDGYDNGFKALVDAVQNGVWPLDDAQLLRPVQVLEAIAKSFKTGKTVKL